MVSKIFAITQLRKTNNLPHPPPQNKVDENSKDSSWFARFHHDMYMNARYPGFVYKNPAGEQNWRVTENKTRAGSTIFRRKNIKNILN